MRVIFVSSQHSAGRRKDMQDIDIHSEFSNGAATLLEINLFLNLPGALRACLDFCDPTEFSRSLSGLGGRSEHGGRAR